MLTPTDFFRLKPYWMACERDKSIAGAPRGQRPMDAIEISDDAESWSLVTLIDLAGSAGQMRSHVPSAVE